MECHFARFGCDILSDDAEAHRRSCLFRPAECPFGCSDLLRFHQLAGHVKTCTNMIVDSPAGNAVSCPFPGCSPFPVWQQSYHDTAHLRSHIEALIALPSLKECDELVRSVLLSALSMWPQELCVACKLAEGDTLQCQECTRFLHEECDGGDNYVANNVCFECKKHVGKSKDGQEEDDDDDDDDDEALHEAAAIDLDGEHFDEDNEEPSSESEGNLTGFVVGDDVVSYSSDSEILAKAEKRIEQGLKLQKKRNYHAIVSEESAKSSPSKSSSMTPKKKKKKKKKKAKMNLVPSPAPSPIKSSKRSGRFLSMIESSSPSHQAPKGNKKKDEKKPEKKKQRKLSDDDDDFK